MKHLLKSICLTLMLTFAVNSSFSQKPHPIELKLDNTGTLIVPEDIEVKSGDHVIWYINDASDVKFLKFKIRGADHPFTTPLATFQDNKPLLRTIIKTERTIEWKYTISYTVESKGTKKVLHLDPKITVTPVKDE